MQPRSVEPRLSDMLAAIEGIERELQGITFEDYRDNWLLRHATQRAVEIISEACRHIPDELKSRFPYRYWHEVADIGNVLRHEYHRVSDRIVWNVLVNHIPELKQHVVDMLADVKSQNTD